ncbi:hypothetical protein POVCU2_0032700 [Plasmodium ovale curtisi]|uniref:Uncharacterized protein n=1 Tax=Plasmodium ovale curtisi TaxID=864141 RepID=A0A1A8W148_PLAOA|nr:hypothetical protein POVCU2_0032700 [Plasmodium ovale curtisi]
MESAKREKQASTKLLLPLFYKTCVQINFISVKWGRCTAVRSCLCDITLKMDALHSCYFYFYNRYISIAKMSYIEKNKMQEIKAQLWDN